MRIIAGIILGVLSFTVVGAVTLTAGRATQQFLAMKEPCRLVSASTLRPFARVGWQSVDDGQLPPHCWLPRAAKHDRLR